MNLSLKKIFVIFLIFLVPVIFFFSLFLLREVAKKPLVKNKVEKSVPTGKTWEILLVYSRRENKLSVKKIALLNKTITQDNRSAKFSPYELKIINSKNSVLFSTKIQITEELIYNIIANPDSASSSVIPSQPKELNTLVYIPDYGEDVAVKIFHDGKLFFEIPLPKKNALRLTPKIFAAQPSGTCVVTAVFISDMYTDFSRFHADVDRIKAALVSTPPYDESMFDFKVIDNTESLGCENGILTCVNNPRIQQIGYAEYPNASKFIVLANQPIQNPYDGAVLGATTGIGGRTGAFSNASDGVHADLVPRVAVHEFLGHAVGLLYDRYVLVGNASGSPRSNCSSNPSGNAFWAQAGVDNAYPGCFAPNLYAPGPLSCTTSSPDLVSGGTPTSIMSAAGCGGSTFDAVETYWIEQNVLPDYQTCSGVTPTPTPTIITDCNKSGERICTPLDLSKPKMCDEGWYPSSSYSCPPTGPLICCVKIVAAKSPTPSAGAPTATPAPAGHCSTKGGVDLTKGTPPGYTGPRCGGIDYSNPARTSSAHPGCKGKYQDVYYCKEGDGYDVQSYSGGKYEAGPGGYCDSPEWCAVPTNTPSPSASTSPSSTPTGTPTSTPPPVNECQTCGNLKNAYVPGQGYMPYHSWGNNQCCAGAPYSCNDSTLTSCPAPTPTASVTSTPTTTVIPTPTPAACTQCVTNDQCQNPSHQLCGTGHDICMHAPSGVSFCSVW